MQLYDAALRFGLAPRRVGRIATTHQLRAKPTVMNETTSNSKRVDRPDHVPAAAVVDMNYHTFAGRADPAFSGDYHLAWRELQKSSQIDLRWTPFNGGHWIAMSAELIADVLNQPELFSSKYLVLPKDVGAIYNFIPLGLDPPEHSPYRAALTPLLSQRVVKDKEPFIRDLAVSLIDPLVSEGRCDYIASFANVFPVAVFHQLVDFPPEERERLRKLALSADPARAESVAAMLQQIQDFLEPIIDERRRNPGDDLVSGLLQSDINGAPMTDQDAMHMCQQLFIGGHHTTAGSLGNDAELRRQLRNEPEQMRSRINELMRRFSLVGVPRTATRDCRLAGQEIKEGDSIYLPLVLFNFDDRVFPEPLDIDFSRTANVHATFGQGIHRCPGLLLGQVEIAIALEEWLARIPEFEIEDESAVVISGGAVARIDRLPLKWH